MRSRRRKPRLATLARLLGVSDGVERRGVGDQPSQEGRLPDVEVGDALAEVGLGPGLHAVGAVAEVDDVEVALEDLVLGHQLLEPAGQHRLAGLAADGLLVAELRRLGREASSGPMTMMPQNTEAVLTYDARWEWNFKTYLVELNLELRTSLVIVTHDHSIALRMDRVLVLADGRLAPHER